jgi:hypothetical protein
MVGYQMYRHHNGHFPSPEWWDYQCGFREDYSDPPLKAEWFMNRLKRLRASPPTE